MKTLDEVIKAFEWCIDDSHDDCDGCPYYKGETTDCHVRNIEALHYLREYRTEQKILSDSKEHYEYWEHKYYAELEKNDPLDWEQLKQMVGKPVWVVEEGYQTWEYWSLVYWMKDDELTLLNENGRTTYLKNEQGTVWQAYRKERL